MSSGPAPSSYADPTVVEEGAARPSRDHDPEKGLLLIFITAKFRIQPEHADNWPEISRSFTDTPRIVNAQVPGTDWSELGELAVDKN